MFSWWAYGPRNIGETRQTIQHFDQLRESLLWFPGQNAFWRSRYQLCLSWFLSTYWLQSNYGEENVSRFMTVGNGTKERRCLYSLMFGVRITNHYSVSYFSVKRTDRWKSTERGRTELFKKLQLIFSACCCLGWKAWDHVLLRMVWFWICLCWQLATFKKRHKSYVVYDTVVCATVSRYLCRDD